MDEAGVEVGLNEWNMSKVDSFIFSRVEISIEDFSMKPDQDEVMMFVERGPGEESIDGKKPYLEVLELEVKESEVYEEI